MSPGVSPGLRFAVCSVDAGGFTDEGIDMGTEDERGITTAEYAVGTAAGAGLAMVLFKLLTGSFGEDMLHKLFDHVMQLLGM